MCILSVRRGTNWSMDWCRAAAQGLGIDVLKDKFVSFYLRPGFCFVLFDHVHV